GVDGAILLSDDNEEGRFYERCVHQDARVVPATRVAVPLLERMEQQGVRGLVATSRGSLPAPEATNVFQPSVGDVASLLLLSKGAAEVMRDTCGNSWIAACEKEIGPICRRASWIARIFHHLRRMCHNEDKPYLEHPFAFIDWNNFEVDWGRLQPKLLSNGLSQTAIEIAGGIQPLDSLRAELLDCDGMDAVRILAAATRMYRPRGLGASRPVEASALFGMLRVAFDLGEFEHDDVFWRMRSWERLNIRYALLRNWRILDPLGVVLDQRYWEHDLESMLSMLKPGQSMAVFKMDLDNFKSINDALGHGDGDDALRLYCAIVKEILGTVGEVYRRGGDEVVVLAPGLAEFRARELAEKLRGQIEDTFRSWAQKRGAPVAPTASIGLAVRAAATSKADLSRLADEAQKQAKQQGKNRVFFLGELA
ncbi:MAG TPA: GGDEF domain-containing protein, partial [Terriglobales bacterium]|nr:GGDEF domain-containing protein [Terriglobales bacterium]